MLECPVFYLFIHLFKVGSIVNSQELKPICHFDPEQMSGVLQCLLNTNVLGNTLSCLSFFIHYRMFLPDCPVLSTVVLQFVKFTNVKTNIN